MTEKEVKEKLEQWLRLKNEADRLEKAISSKQLKAGLVALGMAAAPHVGSAISSAIPAAKQSLSQSAQRQKLHTHIAQHFGIKDDPDQMITSFGPKGEVHQQHIAGTKAYDKVSDKNYQDFMKEKGLDKPTISAAKPPVQKTIDDERGIQGVNRRTAVGGQEGTSQMGFSVRIGRKEVPKRHARQVIQQLRSMPKPNLPKSESEPLDKNKYVKGMMSEMRQQKGLPETPKAGNTLDYSKMKPARGGIIQGQRMTSRSSMPVSGKANKLFDPRLSGTKKPEIKKAGEPQPAIVSEPTIVATNSTTSEPRTVESPNTINGYAIIGNFLKRKKKK